MTYVEADSYLDLYLAPLRPFLEGSEVTDLYVNHPGEIWVEKLGGAVERILEPALDEARLWRLARQIASRSHQGVSRAHPLLAATLPDGSRVQVVLPPATRGDIELAVRRHVATAIDIRAYATKKRADNSQSPNQAALRRLLDDGDYPGLLTEAVHQRRNIVISGGTSAGKTTLLNSLLTEIPQSDRLIFIEDTPELKITHSNAIGLVAARSKGGEAQLTSEDLLQAALRMRPDRIILGELRGAEAFTFLRAINTGHPGSLTTVHADSPERALVQLSMMALQANLGIAYGDIYHIVQDMVDIVVQVERRDGCRRIVDILLLGSGLEPTR